MCVGEWLMGSQNSREKNDPERFLRAFSQEERLDIDRAFVYFTQLSEVSCRRGGVGNSFRALCIEREKFQEYLEGSLSTTLAKRLWQEITCQLKPSQQGDTAKERLDYTSFVAFLSKLLKGKTCDKARILFQLLADSGDTGILPDDFTRTFCELCQAYLHLAKEYSQLGSRKWNLKMSTHDGANQLTLYMAGFRQHSGHAVCLDTYIHEVDIEDWLMKCQLASSIVTALFLRIFRLSLDAELNALPSAHSQSCLIPRSLSSEKGPCQTILSISDVLFLNSHLAPKLTQQWHLLFSTALHGESFVTLMGHVVNKGPCLLVVKDKGGYVFGGFSSVSWAISPKFAGTSECFLFTLLPSYEVCFATGYNSNFMYLNEGQQTLPNGMGMGGQLNHFELWLDADFGNGKCNANCATYRTKQLSSTPEFKIAALEVWRVGPPPRDSEDPEEEMETKKKSILDYDPEAKAMLALIGKGGHSDGLREPDMDDS